MASDLVTPSVEQCCIIKFLVKEIVKLAEILWVKYTVWGSLECSRHSFQPESSLCVLKFRRSDLC